MAGLTGHCMCGKVTWTYFGEPTRNLNCHCADCRRATSARFTAFIGMKSEQLSWRGKIAHYESSPGTSRGFCLTCRTRLYFRSDKWPDEVHVHATTMADGIEYRPTAQVVMRSRVKWLDQLEGIPCYQDFQQEAASPSDSLTALRVPPPTRL